MRVSVLGRELMMPVCAAPTAMQRMAHEDGEVGVARACARAGSLMTLSTLATTSIERVARGCPACPRWFQLYIFTDRGVTEGLVRRAEREGYAAIVLTVDTPVLGRREQDLRNPFRLPAHLSMGHFEDEGEGSAYKHGTKDGRGDSGLATYFADLIDPSLSWADVEWLCRLTRLPVVAKGIMRGEDARQAVRCGCAAVWVSNHGGRQLDTVPATIEVLPEVVRALRDAGSDAEVYFDGGIRRGTDILKALAYGARCVFLGRPILWGLAWSGEEGVTLALQLLRAELEMAMQLCGCSSIAEITPDLVIHEDRLRARL